MNDQRKFTAEEIDQLKCEIIAWLLSSQKIKDTKAAEQYLRTQVHPKLYQTASHLQELMNSQNPNFIRRVADQVGYENIYRLFPQAKELIQSYQAGHQNYRQLADAYTDLASLAFIWSQEVRERLFAAVYSLQIYEMLLKRLRELNKSEAADKEDLFRREHAYLQQQASQERVRGYEPRQFIKIQPVVVSLDSQSEEQGYQIPSFFRLYDPVHQQFDYHVGRPELCTKYKIDSHVSIPWERVKDGMTVEYGIPDSHGFYHKAQHYHITSEQIEKLKSRGTAVPTTMGKLSDIQLFDDHASSAFHDAKLPDSPILTLRATPATLEVKKRASDLQLTVFV